MIVPIEDMYLVTVALMRTVGLLIMVPVFAGQHIPKRVRLVLALLVSILILPGLKEKGSLAFSYNDLSVILMKEIIVGLMMGFAIHMVFFAVEFGGQVIATETSLMRSSSFDPQTRQKRSSIGTLLFNFAMLLFFITGMHREMLLGLVRSYDYVPFGPWDKGFGNIELIIRSTSNVFLVGLKMAAPVMALNFIVTFTFAILGKAAPNFNVFVVSFGARIMAGLLLLFLVVGLIAQYILIDMESAPRLMLRFLMNP